MHFRLVGFLLLSLAWPLVIPALAATTDSAAPLVRVGRWERFEASLESATTYAYPLHDVTVIVDFTAPSGAVVSREAFWDWARTFRLRFSPDEIGVWTWRTRASETGDPGLNDQSGRFECVSRPGDNPLFTHGPLRRSEDRTHLAHSDGTPFFWLADTPWAGPMLATATDWATYLRDRRAKRFTALQVMGTQCISIAADASGRPAFFVDGNKIGVEPEFWRRLDQRFDAANDAGFVLAPTFSWASTWHAWSRMMSPGVILSDDQLVALLRYAQARYGAHHLVWLFGGDANYTPQAARWRAVGRRVYGDRPTHLVAMHPASRRTHFDDFKDEPWLGFLAYQSGHSANDNVSRYLTGGEPTTVWRETPRFPVINVELTYEAHNDNQTGMRLTARDVRRASYWSVLASPTAGVTYGAHGVWSWETEPNIPMSHVRTGVARPWFEAMHLPGSAQMSVLASIFTDRRRPWNRLRPSPELVVGQPGATELNRFVALSLTEDGALGVAYFPEAGPATLDLTKLPATTRATWVDPTNGRLTPAPEVKAGARAVITPPARNAAGDPDYVLLLETP